MLSCTTNAFIINYYCIIYITFFAIRVIFAFAALTLQFHEAHSRASDHLLHLVARVLVPALTVMVGRHFVSSPTIRWWAGVLELRYHSQSLLISSSVLFFSVLFSYAARVAYWTMSFFEIVGPAVDCLFFVDVWCMSCF